LEPPIPLIPVAVEALVEEISVSFIVNSKTNQLLANPDNFFIVIFPKKLAAEIAFIVGVIMDPPTPHQIITP
jgi:DTW domain-containing protein YfiP